MVTRVSAVSLKPAPAQHREPLRRELVPCGRARTKAAPVTVTQHHAVDTALGTRKQRVNKQPASRLISHMAKSPNSSGTPDRTANSRPTGLPLGS